MTDNQVRIYQLFPVWGDDTYDAYPIPPDTEPGDIMLITIGAGGTLHRVVADDEPRDLVYVYRDGVAPTGWVRTPAVDGERSLADQGLKSARSRR